MRARTWFLSVGLALAALVPASVAGAAAPRLEYHGAVLSPRMVEALCAEALRAPRDTLALAAALEGLRGRLEDLGYLDARVAATWDTTSTPRLALSLHEGPRFRIESLTIATPSPADSARFARALVVPAWASPAALGEAVTRAVENVASEGYPYATLGVAAWDADSGRVRVRLSGALGPAVTITRARVEGLRVTRASVAERAMGRLAGMPYHRATAEAARDRLEQLGLFRSVTFAGIEGEGDWSRAQLVYRVEEPRYNQFEGVVGVQGQAGTVGLARVELGNLLGTGRAVGLRWESRGKGVVNFSARGTEPLVLGTPLRLEAALEQQVQDTLFTRTRWGGRALFALSGTERIEGGYEQERVVQERGEVERADVQNTVFALERSTLDAPLGARRGTRARISATQAFKSEVLRPNGRRTARASAVELHGEWNRPFTPSAGVTLEIAAAGRFSSQRVLPVFERYPLGGATTLRGYDEEAFRVDRYALARLEYRWFLGAHGQRTFVFWDHAMMSTREALPQGGDHIEQLQRDGFGFGLRLETAGGLVGVDYGLEPGRPPLEGKIHLQIVSTF